MLEQANKTTRTNGKPMNVDMPGTCSIEGRADVPCRAVLIATTMIRIVVEGSGSLGDAIVIALGKVGFVKGVVSIVDGNETDVALNERPDSKFSRYVEWLSNPTEPEFDGRAHQRIVPLTKLAKVTKEDETVVLTRVIDVSRSGLAIVDDGKFEKGQRIKAGSHPGTVARTWPQGAAIAFDKTLDAVDPTTAFH